MLVMRAVRHPTYLPTYQVTLPRQIGWHWMSKKDDRYLPTYPPTYILT